MFVQTEITPNPNSLKFLPGKSVSNKGAIEIEKCYSQLIDFQNFYSILSPCFIALSTYLRYFDNYMKIRYFSTY